MVTKVGLYRDPRKRKPWAVRWFGEHDPASGKQRRYSKSFRLKAEAEGFQAEKRQELGRGVSPNRPPDTTLRSFCRDWLDTRRIELRPASI